MSDLRAKLVDLLREIDRESPDALRELGEDGEPAFDPRFREQARELLFRLERGDQV